MTPTVPADRYRNGNHGHRHDFVRPKLKNLQEKDGAGCVIEAVDGFGEG